MTSSQASDSPNPEGSPLSSSFCRLHEKVQRWVWEKGWTELRDIQEAALEPILQGATDVILSAATAGGKTEAAFLPIFSRLLSFAGEGVRVLYVSPLRALINDQKQRLEELGETVGISVQAWHGDVSSSRKRAVLRDPSGILLITPESVEVLFVLHGTKLPVVFRELQYVVVDELHSFIGTERGRHLQSLLHRLETLLGRRVPRIALSATLGDDLGIAAEFLRKGGREAVRTIVSSGTGQALRLQVRGYRHSPPRVRPATSRQPPSEVDPEEAIEGDFLEIRNHLFETLRGSDNLVFANSRASVELYADLLRRRSERERVPNEFLPHHGSLSKGLREDAEAQVKDRELPTTIVCTSTLELGIDIGNVASVAQLGAPPSVAGLRQRLGRSGRRADPAVLRIYVREPMVRPSSAPQDCLRTELVQTIAMVRLLLLKRWCEPPLNSALHLSTLIHQLLALIAERGGIGAREAFHVLCESGPFTGIDPPTFARLLRSLGSQGLFEQGPDGTLLHGELGERIVNHYSFFAVFETPEEFRMVSGGETLGSLPVHQALVPGMFLVFAGRRWKILAVDIERKIVDLAPASGGRPPAFGGSGPSVHGRVRMEMLEVYRSSEVPPYLNQGARALLEEARSYFHRFGLADRLLLAEGARTYLFCWIGDRAVETLSLQLLARGLRVTKEDFVLEVEDCSPEELVRHLRDVARAGPADPLRLADLVANKVEEKFDRFLDGELLCATYASRHLDPEGSWNWVAKVVGQAS